MDENAAGKALYVNNCGRESCAPGHRYGPVVRGYHLMHIVASGRGVFDDGARRYDVHAGQGFMIFPDDVTVYAADAHSPWDYVWVGFSGAQAERLARDSGFAPGNPVFDLGEYAESALQIAYGVCEDMWLLRRSAQAALGGLLRLMAYIAQSRCESPRGGRAASGLDSYRRAMGALQAGYSDPDYRVEDVAAAVGLSRSQLFRVFKAQCGRPPQAVLKELRLSHAKRLLSATELSLTETAQASGFASAARLGEAFRDALGLSPTAYRAASGRARERE